MTTDTLFALALPVSIIILAAAILLHAIFLARLVVRKDSRQGIDDQARGIENLLEPETPLQSPKLNSLERLALQELRLAAAIENALIRAQATIGDQLPWKPDPNSTASAWPPLEEVKKFLREKITNFVNGLIKQYTGIGGSN